MNERAILVWRRALQGGFTLAGSATFSPRRVRIRIDGKLGKHVWPRKKALQIVQDAIASGHAPATEYALVPVESEPER